MPSNRPRPGRPARDALRTPRGALARSADVPSSPLEWVQHNRAPKPPAKSLGRVLDRLAASTGLLRRDDLTTLAAVISDRVDETFRRHVRLVLDSRRRVLRFRAPDASLTAMLRARWLLDLRDLIAQSGFSTLVRDIVFEQGTDGLPLCEPPQ